MIMMRGPMLRYARDEMNPAGVDSDSGSVMPNMANISVGRAFTIASIASALPDRAGHAENVTISRAAMPAAQ
jgi:hypothetical protein